jgi:hypothetical protein
MEQKKIINTDIYGYLPELISDGFPAMSSRMRKIITPAKDNNNRDSCYQVHPQELSGIDYCKTRHDILKHGRKGKFHRSLLEDINADELNRTLMDVTYSRQSRLQCPTKQAVLHEILAQMECDVVLCTLRPNGENYISFVHLVFPNAWSAEDAIGRSFQYMHANVKYPNNKHVVPMRDTFIQGIIMSGNIFERVGAFSLRDNMQMQRHTEDMVESDYDNLSELYLRFERQTIISCPELKSFVFFIHSHFVDCKTDPEFFIRAIEKSDPDSYMQPLIETHGDKMIGFLKSVIS